MAAVIETKLKKWGNSFGIVIPMNVIESDNLKEDQNIRVIVVKDSRKSFKKLFGMGKGQLQKTGQQIKDELRRELY